MADVAMGPRPNHGIVRIDQETNRHDLHAVVDQRLHGLAIFALGAAIYTHHHGLAWAVNIGI